MHKYDPDNCPTSWNDDTTYPYLNRVILENPTENPIIVLARPRQLNERIKVQQGVLACSLRHTTSFSVGMLGMLFHSTTQAPVVSKAILKRTHREEFLKNLRAMNITTETLFPGNDKLGNTIAAALAENLQQQIETYKQETIQLIYKHRAQRAQS